MTKDKLQNCLCEIAKYGWIEPTFHGNDRMSERSVDMSDLQNVLTNGKIQEYEYDSDFDNYKCKIYGQSIDGDKLTFIAAVNDTCQTIRCISVYDRE